MITLVKTAFAAIATLTVSATFISSAAAQTSHTEETTPAVLVLNNAVEAQLVSLNNATIENMVAAASAEFAEIPPYASADLNIVVATTTKQTSDVLAIAMNDQIANIVANGPATSSFQVALND